MTDQPIRQYSDALVVESYRNDQNQLCWAFRCWGTDTCDGWLSLGHDTKRWAEIARDRHVAEAHGEFTDEEARNLASDAYRQAVQRIESAGPKLAGHDDGPSVLECAEADRAWDLQKAGE